MVGGRPRGQPLSLGREAQDISRFKSTRRIFKLLDLISQQEGLTAKRLAQEVGVSLSTCYHLINILVEEGYLEKIAHGGGYKLGPAIPLLYKRASENNLNSKVEPVISELAQRSKRHAYVGVLADGEVTVEQVKSPPKSPPVGVVQGFHGASHALALGKVLISSTRGAGIRDYMDNYGLEAFTPRTIIEPAYLKSHLDKVHTLGYATDIEEFAENLCCVAVPIKGWDDGVEGAIGISTTATRFCGEARPLLELAQWAAKEASALVKENPRRKP